MRRVRDEVLAHRIEPRLGRHVAHQQQLRTGRIGGHQPEGQPQLPVLRKPDARRYPLTFAIEVFDEIRNPHQVVDPQAIVHLALEIQPAARGAVEPEYLAVGAEQDRAVRHRGRHAAELAQQRERATLVIHLAPVQPVDDRDDLAPQAAEVRRGSRGARAQPAVEAQKIDTVPEEHQPERDRDEGERPPRDQADEQGHREQRETCDDELPGGLGHRVSGRERAYSGRVENRYPEPRTVCTRPSRPDGSSALRSRRMCTSTVRSST